MSLALYPSRVRSNDLLDATALQWVLGVFEQNSLYIRESGRR
jgi:hypothetical protein